MTQEKFPVPFGFAITVEAYDRFLEENSLAAKINAMVATIDVEDSKQLESVAKNISRLITTANIPDDVVKAIDKSYKKLSGRFSALVAVRSSATAEDLPGASFAGQQATFLNIKGENSLIQAVRNCFASLFTPRAIYYRQHNNINTQTTKISVIVQKMIQSNVSGVMFTLDPVTNAKDRIIIEAVWGLGELIVQGSVVPDRYVVQKETYAILSKQISDQSIALVKVGGENKEIKVPNYQRSLQKISDDEIVSLAKIADKLQKHYFYPQDSEWAIENGEVYIVQTRPITTIETAIPKVNIIEPFSALIILISSGA